MNEPLVEDIRQYVEERLLPKLGCRSREYELREITENTHVNFVYRLAFTSAENKRTTLYIKHAEEFVKKNPSMRFSLERQAYEAKAVELFHKILGDRVPQVVDFNEARHMLVLTDIEHGTLLSEIFHKNIFYPLAWRDLGKSMGKLHYATYAKELWIRPPEANKAHNGFILPFRYTGAFQLAPEASKKHLAEAENEETCIVWGDPLRKNIFQIERESYFLDFENCVRYEPGYDIGYALAELAVQSLNAEGNLKKAEKCAAEFVEGYSSEFKHPEKIAHILHRSVKHMSAIMLHRTTGEKGTNRLDYEEDVRQKLIAAAVRVLNSDYKNPLEVLAVLHS